MIKDVFMENPFVNSAVIDLSNSEIVRFTSKKYNVRKKAHLALFVNKAVHFKMHFIGFQTIYYHADTS